MHLHADIQTKRVTSSRRLTLVAEDNSNGLEVHEGEPYLRVSENCTLFVGSQLQQVVK